MKNVTYELNKSLINLSHVAIADKNELVSINNALHKGILFIDENGPVTKINKAIASFAIDAFGYDFDIWNASFHKSWEKVADAPIEQLVFEQIIHYFSTYGLESLGLQASPYIPVEAVLPENMRPQVEKFTVIKLVSEKEAQLIINEYVTTIVKPNANKMQYIRYYVENATVSPDELKSFELKIMYCDINKIVPKDGQDFLRYLIYKTTNGTLIIKNKSTIHAIKSALAYDTADIAHDLLTKADLVECSKVFLRNKALFLAFKEDKRNAAIINKIRRLAVNNHQPLSEVTVANVMNLLAQDRHDDVIKVLKKTSNRNLIKLINYASTDGDDHIYNIRNGKVYVNSKTADKPALKWLYTAAMKQLKANMSKKLDGKKFYIPNGVDYKAPVSEKQMIGNIPYGTTVSADPNLKAITAAIAWDNYKVRTDIDFHLQSATASFGWNSSYRSSSRDILYSGDMTDATNGATEAFRFTVNNDEIFLASVNLFTRNLGCPFKFFLAGAEDFRDRNKGIIDISKALTTPIKLEFTNSTAMSIGYMEGTTFTFYGGNLGMGIVPKRELYKNALMAITNRCKAMLSLADVIRMAGGVIVDEIDDETVDLSPEAITETAIFEIID